MLTRMAASWHEGGCQNQWYSILVGSFTTHYRTYFSGDSLILVYFSGDWDVHWGYDLDFDPGLPWARQSAHGPSAHLVGWWLG